MNEQGKHFSDFQKDYINYELSRANEQMISLIETVTNNLDVIGMHDISIANPVIMMQNKVNRLSKKFAYRGVSFYDNEENIYMSNNLTAKMIYYHLQYQVKKCQKLLTELNNNVCMMYSIYMNLRNRNIITKIINRNKPIMISEESKLLIKNILQEYQNQYDILADFKLEDNILDSIDSYLEMTRYSHQYVLSIFGTELEYLTSDWVKLGVKNQIPILKSRLSDNQELTLKKTK